MILVVYLLSVLWGFYHADLGVASKPLAILVGLVCLLMACMLAGELRWPWRRNG